jgi:hypothetical protein
MPRVMLLIGLVFSLVGGAFLIVVGAMLYSDQRFAATALRAQGEVIDLERVRDRDSDGSTSTTYAAHIAFTDRTGARHEFAERIRSNPPRFAIGESAPVLYAPDRPSNAIVDDFSGRHGITMIFGIVALPLTILGVTFLVLDLRGRRRRAVLRATGQPVPAEFLHVYRDTSLRINGDHPYRIVAQGRDPRSGALRRYESKPIWVDPSDQLEGRTLRVLVDPERGDHVIDLTGIVDPAARG